MPIRRATAADIPALQNLLAQILKLHHHIRPDLFRPQGGAYSAEELTALMTNDDTPIFVYTDGQDRVVGHLFLQLKNEESSVFKPFKTLFIDDLCVDETARGQNIGTQLYDFALAFARRHGCHNLTLNVWNGNADALRFYRKLGMEEQSTRMEVRLLD